MDLVGPTETAALMGMSMMFPHLHVIAQSVRVVRNLELVGLQGEWFLLEQLDACFSELDPISSGIVDGPLVDQCRG